MKRKLIILRSIEQLSLPTLSQLSRSTDIPEISVKRLIQKMRVELYMDIKFIRQSTGGVGGSSGYYKIIDWGVLDKQRVVNLTGPPQSLS